MFINCYPETCCCSIVLLNSWTPGFPASRGCPLVLGRGKHVATIDAQMVHGQSELVREYFISVFGC